MISPTLPIPPVPTTFLIHSTRPCPRLFSSFIRLLSLIHALPLIYQSLIRFVLPAVPLSFPLFLFVHAFPIFLRSRSDIGMKILCKVLFKPLHVHHLLPVRLYLRSLSKKRNFFFHRASFKNPKHLKRCRSGQNFYPYNAISIHQGVHSIPSLYFIVLILCH
jgi:hypothetical protein